MFTIENFVPYSLDKIKEKITTTTFNKKNRNKQKEYKNIITFDIETTTLSKERAPMYIWQVNVNGCNFYGRYWEEFEELVDYLKSLPHLTYIWVHNLKFEFHYLQSRFNFFNDDLICVKTHSVIRAKTENVIFRCTYAMTNESLKDVIKENDLHDEKGNKLKKLEGWKFDYKKIRHSETELTPFELEYCREDVNTLYYYIKKISADYPNYDKIPLTATGFMRELYADNIERYGDKSYVSDKVKLFMVTDLDKFRMLQSAFAGGYTHGDMKFINTKIENVRSRDKASFYPSTSVRKKFPYGFKEIKDENAYWKMYADNDKYGNCKYALLATFKFNNLRAKGTKTYLSIHKAEKLDGVKQIYGSYYIKDKKTPDDDNGRIYSCKSCVYTLTECDMHVIDEVYEYDSKEYINGMWSRKKYLPTSFVMTILELYKDKTKLKGVLDRIGEYFAKKGKLNACYGCSVENPLKSIIVYLAESYEFEEVEYGDETNEELAVLRDLIKKHSIKRKMLYQWGVYITAYCREEIMLHSLALGDLAKYSDTDSIKYNYNEYTEKYFEDFAVKTVKKNHYYSCR